MRIGILTSGGDAPGMNSVICGAAFRASDSGCELLGIQSGFTGLLEQSWQSIDLAAAKAMSEQAGTFLGTSRTNALSQRDGITQCVISARGGQLGGLIVIGGDGSLHAARALADRDLNVAFVPATIDNDIPGVKLAIGFDSAVRYGVAVVEQLRVTGRALPGRGFLLETLGGPNGNLAWAIARQAGVDLMLVPEEPVDLPAIARSLAQKSFRGEAIAVMSEGVGDAVTFAARLADLCGFRIRPTILGHAQRAAPPTPSDRMLAQNAGAAAVDEILAGRASIIQLRPTARSASNNIGPSPLRARQARTRTQGISS